MTTFAQTETLVVKRRLLPEPEVFFDLTKKVLPETAHGMQTNVVTVKAFQLLLDEEPHAEQRIAEAVTEATNLHLSMDSSRGFKTREGSFYQELFKNHPSVHSFVKAREEELTGTYNGFLIAYLFNNETFMQSKKISPLLHIPSPLSIPAAYIDSYRLASQVLSGSSSKEPDYKKIQEFVQVFHMTMRGESKQFHDGKSIVFPDRSAQVQAYWMDDENYSTNLRIAYESLKSARHFRVLLTMGIWGAEKTEEYRDIPVEWMENMMVENNG